LDAVFFEDYTVFAVSSGAGHFAPNFKRSPRSPSQEEKNEEISGRVDFVQFSCLGVYAGSRLCREYSDPRIDHGKNGSERIGFFN